jgi:hypothetical protein
MNEDDVRRIVREEIKAMGSEALDATIGVGATLVGALPGLVGTVVGGMFGAAKPSGDDAGDDKPDFGQIVDTNKSARDREF